MGAVFRRAWAAATLASGITMTGCGFPAAPLPPSLNLPQRVNDLSAARAGNHVSLNWTMPVRNTDKLLLKGDVAVHLCRRQGTTGTCVPVGVVKLAPNAKGAFIETLPAPLASGPARALTYFVELDNSKGRSAGLSNPATVLAGQAPAAVTGLRAEMGIEGVVLHWNAVPSAQEPGLTTVRLQRTLLTPPPAKPVKPTNQPFAAPPAPVTQNLLVPRGGEPGVVLDEDIEFGETYAYRAERVMRTTIDGKKLELTSVLSMPVSIHAVNVFPPEVPADLAAVATPAHDNLPPSIDLSWKPDRDLNLAGYIVYRRENGQPWQRISPPEPVIGPGFHDAHVLPGHTYVYAVSAIGSTGLESARSPTAQETVPNQ